MLCWDPIETATRDKIKVAYKAAFAVQGDESMTGHENAALTTAAIKAAYAFVIFGAGTL